MKKLSTALLALILTSAVSISASPHVAQDVKDAVTRYRQALIKKDIAALEQIWTDDYSFINSHGRVRTKADRLADLKSGSTTLDKITHEEEPTVRIHGDVAIVSSVVTLVGKYSDKEVSGDFRSTHIWVSQDGRWRLLMNQLTAIEK